ncbi:hypothetical protein QCN27_02900 [Cereibacter sp. SYSU M97828]|nr:hypothetical protein [Cereibacter flavus]
MVTIQHTRWLGPMSAGCNLGNMYVVTGGGFENPSDRRMNGLPFDLAHLARKECSKLLIGTVVPRSVVLITRNRRAASRMPGSCGFFNVLIHGPAITAVDTPRSGVLADIHGSLTNSNMSLRPPKKSCCTPAARQRKIPANRAAGGEKDL